MKRIFLLVLTLCFFCLTAAAGPKLYRHPAYDFSNLRNVKVTVITNAHPESAGSFHAAELAGRTEDAEEIKEFISKF